MPYFHSFLSTDLITPIKVEKCSLLAAALSLDHWLNVINKSIPFFLVLFEPTTTTTKSSFWCGILTPPDPKEANEQGSYYLAA